MRKLLLLALILMSCSGIREATPMEKSTVRPITENDCELTAKQMRLMIRSQRVDADRQIDSLKQVIKLKRDRVKYEYKTVYVERKQDVKERKQEAKEHISDNKKELGIAKSGDKKHVSITKSDNKKDNVKERNKTMTFKGVMICVSVGLGGLLLGFFVGFMLTKLKIL